MKVGPIADHFQQLRWRPKIGHFRVSLAFAWPMENFTRCDLLPSKDRSRRACARMRPEAVDIGYVSGES